MTVLIGILGSKGSGKSTVSSYLMKKYNFIEKAFADPLKIACKELFNLSNNQIYGTQEQKETPDSRWFNCSPRKILQYVGTDLLRDQLDVLMPGVKHNIFTKNFEIWYDEYSNNNKNSRVVISDVRFINEVETIHKMGGIIIKINRPDIESSDLHQSETELSTVNDYDILIDNSKDLKYLYDEIDICMEKLQVSKKSQLESYTNKAFEIISRPEFITGSVFISGVMTGISIYSIMKRGHF